MRGREKNRIALIAVVLALAAVVLVSCGESGGETSGGAISEQQFLIKGNRICNEVFSRITRRYSKLIGYVTARAAPSNAREREMNVGTQRFLVPAIKELVQGLRAVGAPPGRETQFEKTLASLEAGVKKVERDPRAARGSLGVDFAFYDGYEKLWALGLEKCKEP